MKKIKRYTLGISKFKLIIGYLTSELRNRLALSRFKRIIIILKFKIERCKLGIKKKKLTRRVSI